jgi:hypothetical protein
MTPAIAILLLLAAYLAAGVFVGVPFVLVGAGRMDSAARGAPVGFRVLIFPGVVALWPLLVWMWARGTPPTTSPHDTRPLLLWHRLAWAVLTPATAVGLLVALAYRSKRALPPEPVQAADVSALPAGATPDVPPSDRRLP